MDPDLNDGEVDIFLFVLNLNYFGKFDGTTPNISSIGSNFCFCIFNFKLFLIEHL